MLVGRGPEETLPNLGNGNRLFSSSVSVSVSSPAPPKLKEAGLALRLNTRTLSNPSSFGKCTFLERKGVLGADWTRRWSEECAPLSMGIDPDDEDDFKDDLSGFPLDSKMGCDAPRESGGRRTGLDAVRGGVFSDTGDIGEHLGKGTAALTVESSPGVGGCTFKIGEDRSLLFDKF